MHRSGTSALTRVLAIAGCDMPQTLVEAKPDNEAGSWESQPVVDLNDELLASAGSCWDDWRPFDRDWYESPAAGPLRDRALKVLRQEYGDSRLFVLKDPRICRLLPFWTNVLSRFEARPCIVSSIRNPLDVAASLEARDGIDPFVAYLIWLRHCSELDHVRAASDAAARAFGRALQAGQQASRECRVLARELAGTSEKLETTRETVAERDRRLDEQNRELTDTRKKLQAARHTLTERNQQLTATWTQLDATRRTLSNRDRELSSTWKRLEDTEGQLGASRQTVVEQDTRIAELAADLDAARRGHLMALAKRGQRLGFDHVEVVVRPTPSGSSKHEDAALDRPWSCAATDGCWRA